MGDGFVPPKPSLKNNCAFNAVEFCDCYFTFLKSFLDDDQYLLAIFSTRLSNLLEVQLLRYLLVGKS